MTQGRQASVHAAAAAISAGMRGERAPGPIVKAPPAKSEPARQAVQEHVDATPERIAQAAGDFAIVDAIIDKAGERAKLTRQFRDSWITRLHAKGQMTYAQWYACDWYATVHAAAMRSPRVVADYGEGAGGSGCEDYGQPLSERQWSARRKLREARAALPANMLGLFEQVVLDDAMPSFGNGQQRVRFAARIASAAQVLASWLNAPGA